MTHPAIRVENLGKEYQLGLREKSNRDFRELLMNLATAPLRRFRYLSGTSAETERIWALRDVSFEVQPGEIVGIIGRNGAGKSTLLKILTRIAEPTVGRAEVRGHVGSLLEVGTGFHPDLTGRENVFLNGAILGMSRASIQRKFDEIVAFSGVEKFLDTQVKRYSSGMRVRLAFAVAAHLDPEILLIDEVLAVGDAEFQKKCLGKMGDVAHDGRTILFVSHNMQAVGTLCSRTILLSEGQIAKDGETPSVIKDYLQTAGTALGEQTWDDPETAPGNEWIRLQRMRIVTEDGTNPTELDIESPFDIECCYENLKPGTRLHITIQVFNEQNICVFGSGSAHEPSWHGKAFPAGTFRSVCHIPGNLLNDGAYRVKILFVRDRSTVVFSHESALGFEVHEYERLGSWYGKKAGAVRPLLDWSTELVRENVFEGRTGGP